jgi:hypothetical protein
MSTFDLSIRRRDVAWTVALMVLLSAIWVARSDRAEAGGSPPGTGIAVVYIAAGSNFPDALGVGPGGGVNGAPIIILPTDPPIPAASATELVRLDPRGVVIVGGTAAISAAMETALGALLPNATITRIAGADRYGTNALFSLNTFPIEGWASVPGAAFTGNNPDTEEVNIIAGQAENASTGALYAPIQLPHGAEILELKINGFDNDATFDMGALLLSVNTTGSGSSVASVSTSGTPGNTTVSSAVIDDPVLAIVDNENFAYVIYLTNADGDPYIVSVMVRYRLGSSTG